MFSRPLLLCRPRGGAPLVAMLYLLPEELLDLIARKLYAKDYLALGQVCKSVTQTLRPFRIGRLSLCAFPLRYTTRSPNSRVESYKQNPYVFRIVITRLRIPKIVSVSGQIETRRVAELVEHGLRQELRKLVKGIGIATKEFVNKRSAMRRTATVLEFGTCSSERWVNAKGNIDAARNRLKAVIDDVRTWRDHHALKLQAPPFELNSDKCLKQWMAWAAK